MVIVTVVIETVVIVTVVVVTVVIVTVVVVTVVSYLNNELLLINRDGLQRLLNDSAAVHL